MTEASVCPFCLRDDRPMTREHTANDLVAHVAPPAMLSGHHGTRLWPLRTHALRWDTLPVVRARAAAAR